MLVGAEAHVLLVELVELGLELAAVVGDHDVGIPLGGQDVLLEQRLQVAQVVVHALRHILLVDAHVVVHYSLVTQELPLRESRTSSSVSRNILKMHKSLSSSCAKISVPSNSTQSYF